MLPISTPALSQMAEGRTWLGQRKARYVAVCSALVLAVLGSMLAGCGGGAASGGAKAGPISMTNAAGATGPVSALAVANTLKLSMMPTGDKQNAGIDWTVTCGGNPVTGSITNGACGTLAPTHTQDGGSTVYTAPSAVPINSTITITATVSSNPSQSSSVSLTVVPASIGVAFDVSGVSIPNSLLVSANLTFNVQVTNDPVNAGVVFTATCRSNACGSFNPVMPTAGPPFSSTYTAPSVVPTGNTVTITATSITDTSKSASVTLTITTPSAPSPVTVSVAPSSVYAETAGSAHTTHLTAVVINDAVNAGVDWSLQCGATACGTITAHTASGIAATFSAPSAVPPGGTVTITAKSTANPAVSATATANIVMSLPIVVTLSGAPASLSVGTQATLTATVANDAANLGVNWTATCGGSSACGSFSTTHTGSGASTVYTAPASVPAGSVVTITASSPSTTPSNPGAAIITILVPSPAVSFQKAPPAAMTSLSQASISAMVANDVAPGGVNWTVQCSSTVIGACGWVTPAQTASGATATYTAPPIAPNGAATSVTLTATSVADSSVSLASNPIAVTPSTTPAVSFIPSLPSQMQPDATVNLTATVANDGTNAGVDWQVCASGCGFFTIKPALPAIPATATTAYVSPVPAETATSVSGWSNGLPIPYTAPSQAPSNGTVAILALAHADNTKAMSGAITISLSSTGPALNGMVMAGVQPVTGSSVSLYVAGTSGYASAAAPVSTATTDKNGNFTLPDSYSCLSPTSQMYLVAKGGTVGSNDANPNLTLMTALGNCSNLSSTPVVVNEVTTVAAAYATSQFAANDALTGNNSYLYLGTSSGNMAGLANAFAAVNNLVDITTGQPRYFVPSGNAAAPYVQINTVADMLQACTATSGGVEGDNSPCGALFTATDILPQHALYNSIGPADTLQAAFNIAQHPVANYGYQLNDSGLFNLVSSGSPFQPALSLSTTFDPNDLSLSLNYTQGVNPSTPDTLGSFAFDSSGNLWITDTTAGSVLEWNATGAAITPAAGYPAGGGAIAIDTNGNVWISGNNALSELTSLGTPMPGSPFSGVAGGGSDIAIDAQNDLWVANGTGVSAFSNVGVMLSPQGGYTNSATPGINAVAIDSSNNVWVGMLASLQDDFAIFTNPGGKLIVNGGPTDEAVLPQMAADGSGKMWAVTQNDTVCTIPPYIGGGSVSFSGSVNCTSGTGVGGESGLPFYNAQGIALDGAGTIWLAGAGGGGIPILPGVLPIITGGLYNATNSYTSPSLAAGPLRVAIDDSGNVWVLLANNTITEYVGAAAPTVTPLALAVKDKKIGAKP